ncbi:MAG: RNA 3'-terminal phosphate cyclase [Phycisphaerae bacterium]
MTTDLLQLDGSFGEGGGQILRTSLALSCITGRPFRIYNIRANRPKPGLRRQHLTAVLAAAKISGAGVTGAAVESTELTFHPGPVRPGEYEFDVGSAGSTMLVLQTVLPPLMIAGRPSVVHLRGGTHNTGAPPFDFLAQTFLPQLAKIGPKVELTLDRAGFVPAGGGRAVARIIPATHLTALALHDRGREIGRRATATVAGLDPEIARREVDTAVRAMGWPKEAGRVFELPAEQGPGNVLSLAVQCEHVTEVVTGFGQRGVRAEQVARDAARELRAYLAHAAPVGEHLADQLLLPMALARAGSFTTGPLSLHATTNVETIGRFLPGVRFAVEDRGGDTFRVTVNAPAGVPPS